MKKYTLLIAGRYWDDPSEESIFERTLVCEPEDLNDELTELCIGYAEDGMVGGAHIRVIGEEDVA